MPSKYGFGERGHEEIPSGPSFREQVLATLASDSQALADELEVLIEDVLDDYTTTYGPTSYSVEREDGSEAVRFKLLDESGEEAGIEVIVCPWTFFHQHPTGIIFWESDYPIIVQTSTSYTGEPCELAEVLNEQSGYAISAERLSTRTYWNSPYTQRTEAITITLCQHDGNEANISDLEQMYGLTRSMDNVRGIYDFHI